jgi:dephospho-CoA kinase
VLIVVPLLLEGGRQDLVDRVLVVDVDPKVQIQRVVGRDQLESSEVEKMLKAQINRETRLAAADDVLDNSGSPDDLPEKVLKLNQSYLKMAASHI